MTNPTKIGRYEIIERVGRGGMGVLYRGRDTVLEREVAIKVMSADFEGDSDDTARPRFYREARAAAKLQHRNIVTVFEFGEEDNTPFIVMEFLRGEDLARRMRSVPPLTLEEKLDIVADLCTGLHFAHEQGVIHRDVKPANIWIQTDGSIKLLDFGIAKFASSTMTRQGAVLGSVSYMSPEQVSGGEVDGRSDVFSAGVVLYELLTGKKPFEADTPTAVLARIMDGTPAPIDRLGPDVPKPLAAAVAKALQKDRDRRYRHAADFGADLRLVRSALSANESLTLDLEFTRAMAQQAGATTVIAGGATQPAGNVTLPVDQAAVPAPAAREPKGGRWLPAAAVVLALALVGAGYYAFRSPAVPQDGSAERLAAAAPAPLPQASAPAGAEASPPAGKPTSKGTSAVERARRQALPQAAPALGSSSPTASPAVSTEPAPPPAEAGTDVILTGSYPFEVYSEGRLVSSSGTQHRVRITRRQTLGLRAGEVFLDAPVVVDTSSRHVQAPELGRLQMRIPELCTATIGGRNLGEPPYPELQVAAGSLRIQLSCPDGSTRNVPVVVRPGELRTVFIAK